MGTISKKIDLEGLYNTRDLGGMVGADGRLIKEGMMYRSGQLYSATENDILYLREHVGLVIDFRTATEIIQKPDKQWEFVSNIWNPILEDAILGITREESTEQNAIKEERRADPAKAIAFMTDNYRHFFSKYALSQYEQFVRLVMANENKAVLWHCTSGKDRVGFGSFLIQTILGVSKQDIIEDYLSTNLYATGEVQNMLEYLKQHLQLQELPENMIIAINAMFGVREEYIQTIYTLIEQRFGDTENFLVNGIHLTDSDIQKMRDKYLEPAR